MKALICILMVLAAPELLAAQKVVIDGHIDNFTDSTIIYSLLPSDVFGTQVKSTCKVDNGAFRIVLAVSGPRFINMDDGHGNYMGGLVAPGDSIIVTYDALHFEPTLQWSGRGYEKQELFRGISQIRVLGNVSGPRHFPVDTLFNSIDTAAQQIRQQLEVNKSRFSAASAKSLTGYLEMTVLRTKYNRLINLYGDAYERILRNDSFKLSLAQKTAVKNLFRFRDSLDYSVFYSSYLASLLGAYYQDNVAGVASASMAAKYKLLSQKLPPRLRLPVMYLLIEKDIARQNVRAPEDIPQAIFTGDKGLYYNRLLQLLSRSAGLQNGAPAPAFQLEDERKKLVSLQSLAGKVIYLDFWFAACAPCHQLFKTIAPAKAAFKQDTNVVFLTVSVDDRQTWLKALMRYQIGGYHVFTQGRFRDHPIIKDYVVGEYPTAFLIDKSGKIASNLPPQTSEGLIAAISQLLQ